MGTPLNIRNPRAHELARELASLRGIGLTDAVIAALENELRREREEVPLAERLDVIAKRMLAKSPGPIGPPLTREERDAMWSR